MHASCPKKQTLLQKRVIQEILGIRRTVPQESVCKANGLLLMMC